MNKNPALLTFVFLFAVSAVPLRADVTPSDVKKVAEEKRRTIEKNTRQAGEKLTTDQSTGAKSKPPTKKRKGLFDGDALHKDRSLPADDKVPITDDKPRQKKSLNEQLHKDRTNDK